MICDVFQRLPFGNETADEIHAYHVFEHCYRYDCEAILKDWVRVLKYGGKLVLELPCLDSIIQIFNWHIEREKPIPVNLTMWGLFGDPSWKRPEMTHHWCYSQAELGDLMTKAGLVVTFHKAQTHQPIRDMRGEGIK